ncbi:hemin uptake protein HemP [Mariniblastus fucicola]|uniref:Hemin uptake protein hemP n=1 Tax=Mariniblastus fucicola TaxID=980251 RepID=A0A5B9PA79_9BACT|nr:hemin uptake protein HemP [Mariniblastus fucicola]QEG21406.1 Hemin uptake protein hemP [Mariniblastus fucicola]
MPNDPQNEPQSDALPEHDFGGKSAGSMADRMPKIIPFEQLARCGEEIWIECGGQIYRLRRTRQGKLILTK